MTLKRKYSLLAVAFVVVGLLIFFLAYSRTISQRDKSLVELEGALLEGIQNELKTTSDVIAEELGRQIKGKSKEETVSIIQTVLQDIRFLDNKSGYFFAYTPDHIVVALPPSPEKQGDDFSNLQDPNGVYIVREFVKTAASGGGIVEYEYPKPGKSGNQPKLSYVKRIPGSDILIGTGVYIDDVEERVNETRGELNKEAHVALFTFIIGAIIVLGILVVAGLTTISMFRALDNATGFMNRISSGSGDLTMRMPANEKDEIGRLGAGFNRFVEKLSGIILDLRANILEVDHASTEMESTSHSLTETADSMGNMADASLAASRNLSGTMVQLSETTTTVSDDVNNVASAVEELNASISEVAHNCAKESEITNAANLKSQNMKGAVNDLRDASQQIGQVVEIISSIADQTNLLALNATIEAASAGEAGKGFAVVANEVKELAKQSAEATDRIRQQIERLQNSSGEAIGGIEEIGLIIGEIDEIANSIAAAVEEQSSATSEISSLTVRVADSIHSVSDNTQSVKDTSSEVVANMEKTGQLSAQTKSNASESKASAQALKTISTRLTSISQQFKVD